MGGYARAKNLTRADRTAIAESGAAGLLARFEREADPDGLLTPEERRFQGQVRMGEHMARMRYAKAKAAAEKAAAENG